MFKLLQTLFNNIMESGYCSTSWNQGLICAIYKSVKKDNPNSYRGITLSNCLGKRSNTILYNTLQNEVQKNIVLSPIPGWISKRFHKFWLHLHIVSTPFSTSIGLKQDDILSTMFFNLFVNDLPVLLENHNTQSEENESPESQTIWQYFPALRMSYKKN